MVTPKRFINRQRVLLCVALTTLIASVYMVTYSGRIEIADQLQYFNAVSSTVRFGDTAQDVSMWQRPPMSFVYNSPHPLRSTLVEPGLVLAAAPLFWLAEISDGLGLVHTTWLFNIFSSAILCGIFFWYALALGFRNQTAVLATLALAFMTILWPYSQTFFREPLMIGLLLLGAMLWHQHGSNRWVLIVGGITCFGLAFLTKEALILALPALVFLLLPKRIWHRQLIRRMVLIALILAGVVTTLLAFTDLATLLPFDQITLGSFRPETDETQVALHTYLFSLGGSIGGTSPILLLTLPGAWLTWRRGDVRTLWVVIILTLSFTMNYAFFRGEEWFGGTIWPQRFLLPVIPFLMLLCLPVIERLTQIFTRTPGSGRGRSVLIAVLVVLLIAYSLWWQASGVSYPWDTYSREIAEESFGGLAYWGPGFNDPQFIRPVVLSALWDREPLVFAWVRTGVIWPIMAFGGLALVGGILIWRLLRNDNASSFRLVIYAQPLLLLVVVFFAIRAIYPVDNYYLGERSDLHAIRDIAIDRSEAGDVIFLNDPDYVNFFYNYGKVGQRRVVTFNYHPGDRGSFEQELAIVSDNPAELLSESTIPVVHHLADRHRKMWLLTSGGPEIPWSMRPLERFLGQRYYRLGVFKTAPDVRLLEYSTVNAPDAYGFLGSEVPTDLRFTFDNGEALDLVGYTLPVDNEFEPGETLALSIYWRTNSTPTLLYTVAWFLADESGAIVAEGENSWPGATFEPTTTLMPGVPIWDHRALDLPDDLPDGDYRIWVRLYHQDPGSGEIRLLDVSGAEVIDGTIGILPGIVHIGD